MHGKRKAVFDDDERSMSRRAQCFSNVVADAVDLFYEVLRTGRHLSDTASLNIRASDFAKRADRSAASFL